ncbi:MAG: SRPBCC domain-containing protein, partial [Planctomycetota bacterium]
RLTESLGGGAVEVGTRFETTGDAPALAGNVERVGPDTHPEELLLLLDRPAPGIAHLFAMEMGEQVYVSLRFFLYGDDAEATLAREEPVWKAWIDGVFPPAS